MKAKKTPEYYMRQALTLAAEALELGEFPIAAIVVLDDRVITRATASEQRERRFLSRSTSPGAHRARCAIGRRR
jgi:tRNA(Arg) A34 adenosine deaminase TadA